MHWRGCSPCPDSVSRAPALLENSCAETRYLHTSWCRGRKPCGMAEKDTENVRKVLKGCLWKMEIAQWKASSLFSHLMVLKPQFILDVIHHSQSLCFKWFGRTIKWSCTAPQNQRNRVFSFHKQQGWISLILQINEQQLPHLPFLAQTATTRGWSLWPAVGGHVLPSCWACLTTQSSHDFSARSGLP